MEQYIGNTSWANGGAGTGRTIAQTMTEIAGMGINVIRLPLVPQTLNANDPQGTGSVLKNHSSVRIANSRLALETMITRRGRRPTSKSCSTSTPARTTWAGERAVSMRVRRGWMPIATTTTSSARTTRARRRGNPSTVTTTHPYNQTMWLDNLRTVAGLGTPLGVDNIIGIDIFNEPHDYTWAEWKSLTEAAYTAINAVNPNTLLFVQGIGTNGGHAGRHAGHGQRAAARQRGDQPELGREPVRSRRESASTFRRNGWCSRRTPTVRRCSCRRCSWIRRRRSARGSKVTLPATPTATS